MPSMKDTFTGSKKEPVRLRQRDGRGTDDDLVHRFRDLEQAAEHIGPLEDGRPCTAQGLLDDAAHGWSTLDANGDEWYLEPDETDIGATPTDVDHAQEDDDGDVEDL